MRALTPVHSNHAPDLFRYCEIRNFLYGKILFKLHGDNLVSAHRFFSSISPDTLKAIRGCTLYWKSEVPMFVRELTATYCRAMNLDLPRLTAIESRWYSICQKLNWLTYGTWANLQLKGRESSFEIDISALPSDVAKKLVDATASLRWPNEHFASTKDFASYKLTMQQSTLGEEYMTVKMLPPEAPLAGIVSSGSPLPRSGISPLERFRLRRERREQEELSREPKPDLS